jgi:chemotaxis receptor (MCP) glutamine deamidase CheD
MDINSYYIILNIIHIIYMCLFTQTLHNNTTLRLGNQKSKFSKKIIRHQKIRIGNKNDGRKISGRIIFYIFKKVALKHHISSIDFEWVNT